MTIKGKEGFEFIGFNIQGRRADFRFNQMEPIGTFVETPGTKVICQGKNKAVNITSIYQSKY